MIPAASSSPCRRCDGAKADSLIPRGGLRGNVLQDDWRAKLKRDVPREEIPAFLAELQLLVAGLRRWRDDLKVPEPGDVRPLLTPRLLQHPEVTLGYLDDARYSAVVAAAMNDEAPP